MKLRDDLILRKVDNDYLVVDPGQEMVDMSKVFTLNETAAFLWNAMKGQDVTIDSIVSIICDTYDVEPAVARKDATKLFDDLKDQGILID